MASVIQMVLRLKDDASKALKGTADESDKAAQSFEKARAGIAAFAKAGLAAGTMFAALNQRLASSKNELIDASTRTGLATETLAGLRLAAESSGQSFGRMERVLQVYTARIAAVGKGSKEAEDGFRKLGVSVRDEMTGAFKDSDTILRETIAAIAAIEDPTQKAVAATNAFGTSGTRLLQAVSDPSALEGFIGLAADFGVNVGPQAAQSAREWQTSMSVLTRTIEGSADKIVAAFGPGGISGIVSAVGQTIVFMVQLAVPLIEDFVYGLGVLGKTFGDVFKLISDHDFDRFKESMTNLNNEVLERGTPALGDLAKLFDDAQMAAVDFDVDFRRVVGTMDSVADSAGGAADSVRAVVDEVTTTATNLSAIEGVRITEFFTPDPNDAALQSALDDMAAEFRASAREIKLAVAAETAGMFESIASAGTGNISGLLSMAGPGGVVAGGAVSALQTISGGETGAGIISGVDESLRQTSGEITSAITALPDIMTHVLPSVLVDFAEELMSILPEAIIEGGLAWMLEFIPALMIEIPIAMLRGIRDAFVQIWIDVKNFFRSLFGKSEKSAGSVFAAETGLGGLSSAFESNQRGSQFVDRTGLRLLHAGEQVVPRGGRASQSAGGMGGASQVNLTINTNVVDRDAIPALVRQIERHFGSFGRSSSPLFQGG